MRKVTATRPNVAAAPTICGSLLRDRGKICIGVGPPPLGRTGGSGGRGRYRARLYEIGPHETTASLEREVFARARATVETKGKTPSLLGRPARGGKLVRLVMGGRVYARGMPTSGPCTRAGCSGTIEDGYCDTCGLAAVAPVGPK